MDLAIGSAGLLLFSSPAVLKAGNGNPSGSESNKLNVLMIVIDDMNNWVGSMGGEAKTPNIDKLASQGMLFSNAYCVMPACNPSRTAMMTGLKPETTSQWTNDGIWREKLPQNKSILTLPQLLQQNGYTTQAVGKIFHHSRGKGVEPDPYSDPGSWNHQYPVEVGTPGYDMYRDPVTKKALWHGGMLSDYFGTDCFWGPIPQDIEECSDYISADSCAKFLASDHDKPFFFALGISRPHSPQLAPQKYFDMYPLDQIVVPQNVAEDMKDIDSKRQENFFSPLVREMIQRGEWKKAIQAYLAAMTFADDCVGHALEALNNSKYKDNTIVVFWTDNGFQIGEKNRFEKYSLWRLATNCPLIISFPRMKQTGKICERAVSMLDLYPTLVEMAGVPSPPQKLQGISLVPLLKKPGAKREIPAVVAYGPNNYSIVKDEWNFIHYEDGVEELYNHNTDMAEFTNLVNKSEYTKIRDELRKWIPVKIDSGMMPAK